MLLSIMGSPESTRQFAPETARRTALLQSAVPWCFSALLSSFFLLAVRSITTRWVASIYVKNNTEANFTQRLSSMKKNSKSSPAGMFSLLCLVL